MKVLAVVFSARKEGNCSKLATYCLDRFREYGSKVEIIKASQLDIRSCNHCDYECFTNIVGNLSAGGDMALHEALYSFANLGFWPEVLLFPSREYGKNSIKGDLIEVPEVKKRLDEFVKMLVKNAERRRSTSVKSK